MFSFLYDNAPCRAYAEVLDACGMAHFNYIGFVKNGVLLLLASCVVTYFLSACLEVDRKVRDLCIYYLVTVVTADILCFAMLSFVVSLLQIGVCLMKSNLP